MSKRHGFVPSEPPPVVEEEGDLGEECVSDISTTFLLLPARLLLPAGAPFISFVPGTRALQRSLVADAAASRIPRTRHGIALQGAQKLNGLLMIGQSCANLQAGWP